MGAAAGADVGAGLVAHLSRLGYALAENLNLEISFGGVEGDGHGGQYERWGQCTQTTSGRLDERRGEIGAEAGRIGSPETSAEMLVLGGGLTTVRGLGSEAGWCRKSGGGGWKQVSFIEPGTRLL